MTYRRKNTDAGHPDSHNVLTYNISTQQIQIFLKAVEMRNFTKVAHYFSFTPSAISKTITALEDELDLDLFVRGPHELIPTPAGKMLAEEWRQLIGSINNSIIKVRAFQNGAQTRISFGFVDSSDEVDRVISSSIRTYKKTHPAIQIIAEKHDMHRAVELLNFGMLDLIFTSGIEKSFLEEKNLQWEKVYDTGVIAYVPRGNSLFGKESVTFDDLRTQKFTSLDLVMHPAYNDWLFSLCGEHGFVPDIVSTFRTVRSLEFNLRLNDCIFIGETITPDLCDENLQGFHLGVSDFTLMAWRKNAGGEILRFKDYIRRRLQEHPVPFHSKD